MLDKTLTLETANQVLKEIIIPQLHNGMAKEQAIALISVLKNVDKWTVENTDPKNLLIEKITHSLDEQIRRLKEYQNFSSFESNIQLEQSLKETERIQDATEKWKKLNELQCSLIQFLYKESAKNPMIEELYILPLRIQIREQLNLEMSLVR